MNLIILVGVVYFENLGFYQFVNIKPFSTSPELTAELIVYIYLKEFSNLKFSDVFASSLATPVLGSSCNVKPEPQP